MDSEDSCTSYSPPICDWLKDANIYNQNFDKIPISTLLEKVDAIVLYFSMRNTDRFNVIQEFCDIYKTKKHVNFPVEVVNVPMDDNRKDMWKSYEEQANWLTLKYGDPLIPILQYRYGITSVPHLLVMHTDGTIISSHGILDLDVYGMNALIAWMTTPGISATRLNRELSIFNVMTMTTVGKYQYKRKFSLAPQKQTLDESDIFD